MRSFAFVQAQSQVDINNLITALKDDESSQIAHECGTSFAVPISTAESLVTTLASIKEMVYDISDKFSCPVIVPFYIKLVHKDICVGTMEAFGWTYTSLFLISFFGMFVITLRATCWEWDLKDWQEADELSQPFKIDQSYSTVATDADMKSNLSSRI